MTPEAKIAEALGRAWPTCATCHRPATCLGVYEGPRGEPRFACDTCCGHGQEDGHCYRLPAAPASPEPRPAPPDLTPVVCVTCLGSGVYEPDHRGMLCNDCGGTGLPKLPRADESPKESAARANAASGGKSLAAGDGAHGAAAADGPTSTHRTPAPPEPEWERAQAIVGAGGRIALAEAARCPGCGRMVMFVVNRAGKTLCVECDALPPAAPPSPAPRIGQKPPLTAERIEAALREGQAAVEACAPLMPGLPGTFRAPSPAGEAIDPICTCGAEEASEGEHAPFCRRMQTAAPSPATEPAPCPVGAAWNETTPRSCFSCGAIVEPTPCHCGAMHVGVHCWPCHHKNYPDGCAAPHCPDHGYLSAKKYLDGRAPAPSSPAPKEEP